MLGAARDHAQIMGILNVTPDSFSDGGAHDGVEEAIAHACLMTSEGADIIDVGGESTRPGASPVDEAQELSRVQPVIKAIAAPDRKPVSIDTYKASVARAAAEAGAVLVNDVTGMSDPEIASAAAETGAAYVLTYHRGTSDAALDVARDMPAFFEEKLTACEAAGLPREHVILDPGVGFAKTLEQNYAVLAAVTDLTRFDLPILIGVSRKSLIGKLTGAETADRLPGTLAAGLDSLQRGAHILRVHDVAEHRQAISVWEAINHAAH